MHKYIIWNKDNTSGKIIILVGYCFDSLKNFKEMFEVALKAIPTLKEKDTICSKVRKSRYIQGYKEISWDSLEIDSY